MDVFVQGAIIKKKNCHSDTCINDYHVSGLLHIIADTAASAPSATAEVKTDDAESAGMDRLLRRCKGNHSRDSVLFNNYLSNN